MTTLRQLSESNLAKVMLIGDSGSGKTGALASLAIAGYHLHIVDMDDGLSPLAHILRATAPEALDRVDFQSFRDSYRTQAGELRVVRPATAYQSAAKCLDKWLDDSKPAEWGPQHVFVVDSLTLLGRAALAQAETLAPGAKDRRQWFFAAQQALENYLAVLFGPDFATNVVVLTHITDIELNDGSRKGFPSAIGQALSRHIAKYLNDLFIVETKGVGANVRRVIRTVPNGMTDAKTAAIGLEKELPIETGLATIFAALRGTGGQG